MILILKIKQMGKRKKKKMPQLMTRKTLMIKRIRRKTMMMRMKRKRRSTSLLKSMKS